MIKNATIYRLAEPMTVVHHDLDQLNFAPTLPTQQKSLGWVPPADDSDALVHFNSGARVMRLRVETRTVPAATIAEHVAQMCKAIEQATGRKPGKKEKRDLKEEALTTLLPHAFPKQKDVLCILDGRWLILDTTSPGLLDDAITALVKCLDGLVVEQVQTNDSPAVAMAEWLHGDTAPDGFSFGNACELKARDESSAKVRYTNHYLLTDEVKTHLAQGKLPTSLAMEFDDRVAFTLTDTLQLKKIDFGDKVMEEARSHDRNPGDLEGSMAIAIGEFRPLLGELVAALGGHAEPRAPANPVTPPAEYFDGDKDPMYDKAVKVVLKNRKASISLVQRHLQIGYNRAARLLEAMEKAGVVSRMGASGHGEVLQKSPTA
jgi:recombination associated protein RdgC